MKTTVRSLVIESDGRTVWVNGPTILLARFGRAGGEVLDAGIWSNESRSGKYDRSLRGWLEWCKRVAILYAIDLEALHEHKPKEGL